MGDYNEELTIISDAYEIPRGDAFPLPFIYGVEVVRLNGYLRLMFGASYRKAALHLIDTQTREEFIPELRALLQERINIRIEIV